MFEYEILSNKETDEVGGDQETHSKSWSQAYGWQPLLISILLVSISLNGLLLSGVLRQHLEQKSRYGKHQSRAHQQEEQC